MGVDRVQLDQVQTSRFVQEADSFIVGVVCCSTTRVSKCHASESKGEKYVCIRFQ